jgi:hypothetical protein
MMRSKVANFRSRIREYFLVRRFWRELQTVFYDGLQGAHIDFHISDPDEMTEEVRMELELNMCMRGERWDPARCSAD